MKKTILTLLVALTAQSLFAQNPLEGFTKSENGVWYKFEKHNESGQQVKEGDIVVGQASIRLGDSIVMNGFTMPAQPIFKVSIQQNVFKGDLMEGLILMKTGEICTFAFPHDSIAKAMQLPPFFKKEDYSYFRVSINSLTTEEAMRVEDSIRAVEQARVADSLQGLESGKISAYLKEKNYSTETINGIYFIPVVEGTGIQPENDYEVQVNYTGRFLNGKLFDSSVEETSKAEGKHQEGRTYEPLKFTIGHHMMIEGFERGVKMMKEGGKAIVILPSALAYGGQQRGEIEPYSPLVFELELVKVTKKEPAPEQTQPQTIKVQPDNTSNANKTQTTPANANKKPATNKNK